MEVQTCPNCNHQNRSGAKYCAQCGQTLPVAQVQPTIQAPEPAPTPIETPEINCPHCGHPNRVGAVTCMKCGRVLRSAQQSQPAAEVPPAGGSSKRVLWIVGGILLGLMIICVSVMILVPNLIDSLNPFDDVDDIISPIETAIGPIDLTSIPEQIETAIPLDLTELPLELPSEIPLEIPTPAPVTVPGLGIELNQLTDEEEIEIGRQAAAEFESENPISSDQALVDRVVRIGNTLVPHS